MVYLAPGTGAVLGSDAVVEGVAGGAVWVWGAGGCGCSRRKAPKACADSTTITTIVAIRTVLRWGCIVGTRRGTGRSAGRDWGAGGRPAAGCRVAAKLWSAARCRTGSDADACRGGT